MGKTLRGEAPPLMGVQVGAAEPQPPGPGRDDYHGRGETWT